MNDSELALWRYSVIAPLLHVAGNGSLAANACVLAAETKLGLDGQPLTLSAVTILRWLRRYRASGLAGLENRPRKDRGMRRALDAESVELLASLSASQRDWTVRAIHREAEQRLKRRLSLKAAYRLLVGHRRRAHPPEAVRRRPVGVPQILWLADTMHGPSVYGARRQKRKSYLIAFLDDASRAIMAARFATADDVAALIPILREAILARGCPSRLLCDNGANYRSRVLRAACAHLGIHLVYATPYHPESKARLERFFLTVRLQFLPTLPAYPTLDVMNAAWARFVAVYHARPHGPLTELEGKPTSPLSYYLTHLPPDIKSVSELKLDELLVVEEPRRVQRDATLRVGGRVFEVDAALAGDRVVVRFNPADPSRVSYRPFAQPKAPFIRAFPLK
jgi:transposase InsO family protein